MLISAPTRVAMAMAGVGSAMPSGCPNWLITQEAPGGVVLTMISPIGGSQ
jgi:hypothetical protein